MIGGSQKTAQSQEAPPLRGQFADNFILSEPPKPAPAVSFSDRDGRLLTLEDFRGRAVLLNFWATWCGPCVREMPALDRLQADLGPEGLQVIALSVDRQGLEVVEPFYRRLSIEALEIYLDPANQVARSFTVPGLPTTYLIDPDGRMVGVLAGPAEWDSPDALALMRHYLPQGSEDPEILNTKSSPLEPSQAQRVGTGSSPE